MPNNTIVSAKGPANPNLAKLRANTRKNNMRNALRRIEAGQLRLPGRTYANATRHRGGRRNTRKNTRRHRR